MNFINYKRSL